MSFPRLFTSLALFILLFTFHQPIQADNAVPENGGTLPDDALTDHPDNDQIEDGVYLPVNGSRPNRAPLPATVFDLDQVAWSSNRDYTSSDFAANFTTMKNAGYMLIDIEVDEVYGVERIGGVWQYNTDGRGWAEHRNISSATFSTYWNDYRDMGWRLIDQESYRLNGTRYYAGIWVENVEDYSWTSNRNLTSSDFSDLFATYKAEGKIIIDVEAYDWGTDETRYGMVWVHNAEGLAWAEHRNLTSSEYSDKYNQYRNTHRVWDVESYVHDGNREYAGIWIENENGRGWAQLRNMTATDFGNNWERYADQGYRLVDYEVYPYDSGYRYAGVWRQNGDRLNWHLRATIDSDLSSALSSNNLVGIGAVIIQDGEVKYRRGVGDRTSSEWYSALTVNRLASISKAVAGVLLMQMVEDGTVALDDNTTSYITWPFDNWTQHTHELWELAANRGGIGNYTDYSMSDFIQTEYSSAASATNAFLSQNPFYTPGTDCRYSTQGYTVLGAGLEGATGDTISEIVTNYITNGSGPATLRVEDRSVFDTRRSTIYRASDNSAYSDPDSLSWKVLGGGLEATVLDLAYWGDMLLDGDIISGASLAEVWVVPASPCSTYSYGLGWDLGFQNGRWSAWKSGGQPGATTGLCIYPDDDLVVAVMSNTWNSGVGIATCHDLADTVLDNPAPNAPPNTISAMGLLHTLLGGVEGSGDSDSLTLTQMGTTGNGGVDVELDNAGQWESDVTFEYAVSGDQAVTLRFDGRTDLNYGTDLQMTADAGSFELLPGFGSTSHVVRYFNNGTQLTTSSDSTVRFNPGSNCTTVTSGGLTSKGCTLHVTLLAYGVNRTNYRLKFDTPIWISVANVSRYVDEIHFDEGGTARAEAGVIDDLEITSSGIDRIVLANSVTTNTIPTAVTLGKLQADSGGARLSPLLVVISLLSLFAMRKKQREDKVS